MIHTHTHTHLLFSAAKNKSADVILFSILLVLLAMAFSTMRAASPAAIVMDPIPVVQGSGGSSTVANGTEGLPTFAQKTQALVASGSKEAFQALLVSFKDDEPLAQRHIVLAALQGASPAVVPVLMTALTDPDPGVRAGAAQVLGLRHEDPAIAALTIATRDPSAGVRLQAVRSLDILGAWQALPRLEQLGLNEGNDEVRQAASTAQEHLNRMIADEIGVSPSQLRGLSVTTSDAPQIYAVTTGDLYARDETHWKLVSRLPDAPLALATGENPQVLYLATVSSGLYSSLDGGDTWKHVEFGLQTPTQLTVTALVVDPQDSRRVYIALAAQGAQLGIKDPLGIMASTDGGATWPALPDAPTRAMTTQLVVDPQWPGYLFGMAANAPWRYTLPSDVPDSQ